MQHRFVMKLFRAAKSMGIHTAIDTNGHLGRRLTDEDLEAIDLVMLSIKTWDPERHRVLTGMDNGPALEFARRLAARKRPIWVRFVLVPGLTDDQEDIAQIAQFAADSATSSESMSPFSSDGPLQVEGTRNDVHAERYRAAVDGSGRSRMRAVPIRRPQNGLESLIRKCA